MKKYILSITYNFDGDYIAKSFDTEKAAISKLNEYLFTEVDTVQRECEYKPSVIKFNDDDVVLVYAEGYDEDIDGDYRKDYPMEDCAMYRVFEVEI